MTNRCRIFYLDFVSAGVEMGKKSSLEMGKSEVFLFILAWAI